MEEYANEKTIVKDNIYEMFKDTIICPICNSIMIEPVICVNCQNTFCKKCKENGENCPGKCQESIIKDVIEKNNNITKFKFKCIKGCGQELLFKNLLYHYCSDCLSQKEKAKALTPDEVAEYKEKIGQDTPHVTSK